MASETARTGFPADGLVVNRTGEDRNMAIEVEVVPRGITPLKVMYRTEFCCACRQCSAEKCRRVFNEQVQLRSRLLARGEAFRHSPLYHTEGRQHQCVVFVDPLSVTLFEKVPVDQLLRDLDNYPEEGTLSNQLKLL